MKLYIILARAIKHEGENDELSKKRLKEIREELNSLAFDLFLYDRNEDYDRQLYLEKEYMELKNKEKG